LVEILEKKILKKIFGFDNFRSGQEEIIDAVNDYKNVLALMPTGGGKSLCYQLPALLREGTALVVSPLIALMRDQVRFLVQAGVEAAALHSQNSDDEIEALTKSIRLGKLKILYVAPERLSSKSFMKLLRKLKISFIAVDEAHCVSQWGHDFRPDYLKIGLLRKIVGDVQIAAFTASADPDTRREIVDSLFIEKPKFFLNGFDRPNISLTCTLKDRPRKQLFKFLQTRKDQTGIIYCGSRARTEVLSNALVEKGYKSAFYHAGMTSEKRKQVENRFQCDDGLIVCATIAFGMGIDKPDVRFVVHVDLPKSIENFYQEIGRAGRDGLPADSLLLYSLDDVRIRRMQIDETLGHSDKKDVDHGRLNSLLGFVEAQRCRRSFILEYFEKKTCLNCNNCDLCKSPPDLFDATEAVQKVLSVILRTRENFGANHLIDILTGTSSVKVRNLEHDQLSIFGLGYDLSKQQWESIFLQILGLDYIRPSSEHRGAFYLTKQSLAVLKGHERITLKLISVDKARRNSKTYLPKSMVSERDEPLFAALRQKRKSLAASLNVPSYLIFSDRTLIEMIDKKPTSFDEMHLINGVGQKKLLKFGDHFLKVINGMEIKKTHPIRKKIAGRPNVWLYDLIERVILKYNRGLNGLEKPIHVSPSLILKIFESQPKSLTDLKNIKGMTDSIFQRYGKAIMSAISSGGAFEKSI
tara:strand:+ start:5575 stop:7659 length:2085 start_codon:yes stop_codon:yes gene_type:complete